MLVVEDAEPGGVDLVALDSCIVQRFREGFQDQLFGTGISTLAEASTAHAQYHHLVTYPLGHFLWLLDRARLPEVASKTALFIDCFDTKMHFDDGTNLQCSWFAVGNLHHDDGAPFQLDVAVVQRWVRRGS